MADDERRVEIEAVARVLSPGDLEGVVSLAEDIMDALDAVRDARGDDEARPCCGGDPSLPHIAGCLEIARERAARSPQGEDHEAFYWRAGMTRDGHQWVRQDEADAEIRRLRALARVSPQGDRDSVAAEDVEAVY